MKSKTRSFAVISLLIGASRLSFGDTIMQAPATNNAQPIEHVYHLDKPGMEKRKALNDAGRADLKSETSAGYAFDAMMDIRHVIRVPKSVAGVLRSPLANAEAKYWRGETKGITEDDLVKTINNLATNLNAPPGALTTKSQIRSIRLSHAADIPSFMGKGMFKKDGTYNKTMSPLQATYSVFALMSEKSFNPDFAVDPATWEKNLKAHKHTPETLALLDGKPHTVTGVNSDHLRFWLEEKNISTTSTDGIAIVLTALSTLGLQ